MATKNPVLTKSEIIDHITRIVYSESNAGYIVPKNYNIDSADAETFKFEFKDGAWENVYVGGQRDYFIVCLPEDRAARSDMAFDDLATFEKYVDSRVAEIKAK